MTDTRTVVYEDGQWLMTPPDKLVQQFGKPVDEIIAAERAESRCAN